MGTLITIIMGLLLIGVLGFVFIKYKNKIVTEKESILTAQDLLDIKEVNQDIGITKDKRYIKILELSCINYFLLSNQERGAVNASFSSFLMSLNFPVQFYVQTRLLDLTTTIESLRQDISSVPDNLHSYGGQMLNYLSQWISMRTVMIRTPYIVFTASSTDPQEAFNELQHRQQMIIDGLSRCEITAKALKDRELTDLWYAIYNKNRALIAPIKSVDIPLYIKGDEAIESSIKNKV